MALPFDPSTLARFGSLGLIARGVVEGFLTGVHKSPFKGYSVEFAEHRQYYPGDEIRHVDWRVLGKTDRYFIKEYEEETNLNAYIIVDASGSMSYRGKGISKFAYAQQVAASLAYLLLHQLDAVGCVTHDAKLRQIVPPRTSARQLNRILKTLEETIPGGETALAPLWHELAAHHLRRRGMVIVLSDCFDDPENVVNALKHFRHRKQEVLLFHILAPEEIEFSFARMTRFDSLERNQQVLTDPARMRREYLGRFETFCKTIREGTRSAGIDYHMLRTDQPVERSLGLYLAKRQA